MSIDSDATIAISLLVSRTSPFVSKVLERILLHVHPADAVICLNAHWHIGSVAGQVLRYNLGMPKNGVLLLKYPQCFARKEDLRYGAGSNRFLSSIRHNINSKYPTENGRVIKEFRKFLAGYETILLNVVCANLNFHTDLNTFIIDFSLYGDEFPHNSRVFFYTLYLKELPLKVIRNLTPDFAEFRSTRQILFVAWKRWTETITEVVSRSASSLKNFIFIAPDEKLQNLSTLKLELPRKLYAALRFDKLLAKMHNLRTLQLPALRKYENAVIACRRRKNKSYARQQAWKALYALPENERLPNLKRIVVHKWGDLISCAGVNAATAERVCGLPSFLSSAFVLIQSDSVRSMPSPTELAQFPLVFPSARVVKEKKLIFLKVFINDAQYAEVLLEYPGDHKVMDLEELAVRTPHLLGEGYLEVDGLPVLFERLSILSVVAPAGAAYNRNKLHASFQCPYEPCQEPIDAERMQSWCAALCRMPTANASLPAKLTFTIQCVSEKEEDKWEKRNKPNAEFSTQLVLPLFAVDGQYALPASTLHACRLKIELKGTLTVSGMVRNWGLENQNARETCTNESSQRYKFPPISLHMEWPFWWGALSVDKECAVPAVLNDFYCKNADEHYSHEQTQQLVDAALNAATAFMTSKIDAFLLDAVESYRRRDLAFCLYQRLTQCRFVLSFTVMNRKPTSVLERQILAMLDAAWTKHAMQYERQLLVRIHDGIADEDCLSEYALALPALKRVQLLMRFSYVKADNEH